LGLEKYTGIGLKYCSGDISDIVESYIISIYNIHVTNLSVVGKL
jgi:hypothetical protein